MNHRFLCCFIAVLIVGSISQTVTFSRTPKHLALYPRDINDSAVVAITGNVNGTGYDSLFVSVKRNGVETATIRKKLTYDGSTASFDFSPKIRAELAEYSLILHADTTIIAFFDSIVAGDVYLIDGQSNAVGGSFGTPRGKYSGGEFLRSYGISGANNSDQTWGIAQCSTYYARYAVGVWGIELGKQIIDNHSIPVCIINNGVGSTFISSHITNPLMRQKTENAGVRTSVKAIIWHQGEADNGLGYIQYPASWKTMTDNWRTDYPSLRHIYLYQVQLATQNLREVFRQLPKQYHDNHVMALYGAPGFDGIHYADTGYRYFGQMIYPLIARDFYGLRDTAGITPPDIQRAFFANEDNTRLLLEFDQPVLWPPDVGSKSIRTKFRLPNFSGKIDSGSSVVVAGRNCIRLALSMPCSSNAVSYLHDGSTSIETAPFLLNSRGRAALAFTNFPITFFNPDPLDTLTVQSVNLIMTSDTVKQFDYCSLKAICSYTNGMIDTTVRGCVFMSLDTMIATVDGWGTLYARNTGSAKLVVSKRGMNDTIHITVLPFVNAPDSIKFLPSSKIIITGDSAAVALIGYFHSVSMLFVRDVTFSTVWTSTDESIVSVRNGFIHGLSQGSNIRVMASLAGKSDTMNVTVNDLPSVVKRINFQTNPEPFKDGWLADNGSPYSSARGFGWITGARGMTREDRGNPNGNFLLNSFVSSTGIWRLDVPAGSYVVKVGMGDVAWGSADSLWYGGRLIAGQTGARNIIVTDTLVAIDTSGLSMSVKGAIDYIVVISNEGADINLVADDDGKLPPISVASQSGSRPMKDWKFTSLPNPFSAHTCLQLIAPGAESVRITLTDVRGVVVREFNRNFQSGRLKLNWDGRNMAGEQLSSGWYMVRIETAGKKMTNRLLLIR